MPLLLTGTFAFLYATLVEYCLHRFVQHHSYEMEHIKNHHRIFHGIKSYESDDARKEDILSDLGGILLNGIFYMVPAVMVFIRNRTLGFLFISSCFIYNIWEEFIHYYSHKSYWPFLGKLYIPRRLKEHHRVHHYIYNSNFGIGATFWDIVFGTKRAADKEREGRMGKED